MSIAQGILLLRIAWSPDGKYIASAFSDSTVQVWKPDDGKQSFTFNTSGQVLALAWSPDGKRITSASRDGMIQVYNLDNRKQTAKSFTFDASGPVVWSPDGQCIAFASRDGTIQVWKPDDREALFIHKSHRTWLDPLGTTISVAWSPDSRRVASAYKDGLVHVWSADGSGQPFIYKGHFNFMASYRLGSLIWSPDGKYIASAFIDKTVQVWNPDVRGHIFTYKAHLDYVKSVAWSPDGKRIASASRDGIVQVWSPDQREQSFSFEASGLIAWSPDGKYIASGSRDGIVQVRNADGSGQPFFFNASGPFAWSPDGKHIASGSRDGIMQVHNTDDSSQPFFFNASGPIAQSPKVSKPEEAVKSQVNNDKTVQGQVIGDLNTVHQQWTTQHFHGSNASSQNKGMQQIKALFLAANPRSTTRLAIDEEMHAIEQKFRAAEHRDALVFQSAWAVQPDNLLQLLNQHQPHIVHFSGHGSGEGLSLAGDNGQERLVTTQALKSLFTTLKDNIRLVFLNACYSREQALVLVETIDCVIGMKESIGDDAATVFASSFYRAIGFGRSIQEAFEQGITSLLLEGILQEDIPELLVKKGVDAKKIFLIAPANP